MEQLIQAIQNISDPKTAFILCAVFIIADIITGYLKSWKFNKTNSSISRDGYIKKVGWFISLLVGYIVKVLIGVNIVLVTTMVVCVATEGMSFYENLGELGIQNLPFAKHFEKLKGKEEK